MMKLVSSILLLSLGGGGAAFAATSHVPQRLAPQLAVGHAAAPHRVVPMAFMPPPPPPTPPPPPPPPSPQKQVDDALAKYLGASAKKGINSAQARAAMEAYKATLASQGQV